MTRAHVYCEDSRLASELVATASTVADEVCLICLGTAPSQPPAGVTSILVLKTADSPDVSDSDPARPEDYTDTLARLARERTADLVLVGATVSGWEIAARLATILGVGLISEATTLRARPDGCWESERVMYAGAAVQTEVWTGLAVVTIALGHALTPASPPGAGHPDPVVVETISVRADPRVRVISRATREAEGVDLASAARIVCVGMGASRADDLPRARELADALGAEIACTRPVAEERRLLPTERYIGISGASVRPDLYLSLGVSGQVQHTFGIRDSKIVVGVNTNPDVPLFRVCDYGVVGDLREIAPLLTAALRERRAGSATGEESQS